MRIKVGGALQGHVSIDDSSNVGELRKEISDLLGMLAGMVGTGTEHLSVATCKQLLPDALVLIAMVWLPYPCSGYCVLNRTRLIFCAFMFPSLMC